MSELSAKILSGNKEKNDNIFQQNKTNKLAPFVKQYNLFIVLLPILTIYKSPIPTIDLGLFFSLYFAFMILVFAKKNEYKFKVERSLLAFVVYVLLSTCFTFFINEASSYLMVILRTGKLTFMIIVILMVCKSTLFNFEYFIKVLKIITLAVIVYIVVQYIAMRVFHAVLPNVIIELMARGEQFYNYVDYEKMSGYILFRPTSFFLEPSHFAQFVLPYLVYCIFGDEKPRLIQAVFISFGILLSTSGLGIALGLVVWGLYFGKKILIFMKNRNIIFPILIVIAIIVGVILLMQVEMVNKTVDRMINPNAHGGNSILARITGYEDYAGLSVFNKIYGMGYGNPLQGRYFSSFSYTLYCSGIIGALLVINIFFNVYKKGNRFQKVLSSVIFISILGDTTFTAVLIVFYFSLLLQTQDKCAQNNKTLVGDT